MRGLMIFLLLAFVAVSYADLENPLLVRAKDTCAKGATKTCSGMNGFCQSKKSTCSGETFMGKKYCKGKSCVCCVEKETTTPELTTTVKTTTTAPEPTTTTNPAPTTTGNWNIPPQQKGDGCIDPVTGMYDISVGSEASSECMSYICTVHGWALLDYHDGGCCMFDERAYPQGTVLTIMDDYKPCEATCTEDGWMKEDDGYMGPLRRKTAQGKPSDIKEE